MLYAQMFEEILAIKFLKIKYICLNFGACISYSYFYDIYNEKTLKSDSFKFHITNIHLTST